MSVVVAYVQASELPPFQRGWLDAAGDPVDLSTSTLSLRIESTPPIEKTIGVTGDANGIVTVVWSAGELDDITPGVYQAQVWARDGAGLDRVMPDLAIRIDRQVPLP